MESKYDSPEQCRCQAGEYCEYFERVLTLNPPNWQWCQGATQRERFRFKVACDANKRKRQEGVFKTKKHSELVECCLNKLLPKLVQNNISAIAAVPRSGYIPASICATSLGLPMYHIIGDELVLASARSDFGGLRMNDYASDPRENIAVIDDTVCTGAAMAKIKEKFPNVTTACVYTSHQAEDRVDLYAETLEIPHILEWHFFNSPFVEKTLFDLDGIFCQDVPIEVCRDEDAYIDFITNVDPIYSRIPSNYTCYGIVTGRLEKYRDITEKWLEKNNIKFKDLIMFPTQREKERDNNHIVEVAKYKAKFYSISKARFFVESNPQEASLIYKGSTKNVICPEA